MNRAGRGAGLGAERLPRFHALAARQPALQKGDIRLLDSPADTLLFLREHEGTSILACFNFASTPSEFRIPAHGKLEILAGHGFTACIPGRGAVTVPAYGAFFANIQNGAEATA